ncbi:MAG: hypothetical protein WAK31_18575 [Chthoniobacterales bacterium]
MLFAPWGEIILKSVASMRLSILCLGFLGALPLFSVRQQASGFHDESIQVKGRTRTYRLFVPSDLPNPVPLVFVFHGTETPGHGIDSIIKITRFEEIAQIHQALIIFPEAYEGNWNDGRLNNQARSYRDGIDDIAFVDAMLAQTEHNYHVDRTRIDATGFSNGAIFCHYLAAHRSKSSRRLLRLAVRSRSRFRLGSIQRSRCHCSRFTVPVTRSYPIAEGGSQTTVERYLA